MKTASILHVISSLLEVPLRQALELVQEGHPVRPLLQPVHQLLGLLGSLLGLAAGGSQLLQPPLAPAMHVVLHIVPDAVQGREDVHQR